MAPAITCHASVNVYGNGPFSEQAKCFPSAALCSNNTAVLMSGPPPTQEGRLMAPSPPTRSLPARTKEMIQGKKNQLIHLKCGAAALDVQRAALPLKGHYVTVGDGVFNAAHTLHTPGSLTTAFKKTQSEIITVIITKNSHLKMLYLQRQCHMTPFIHK